MSDNDSTTKSESPAKAEKKIVTFTEKEEMVLKVAWRCLKSGPPEIDMDKLTKAAGFNTLKTATNTWGVIKKKLFTDVDNNTTAPGSPSTPKEPKTAKAKKGTPTPKKRNKKAADDDDDEDDDEGRSVLAKRKKPSPVKKMVKSEDSDDE
ncbi:hypothetical protein E4T42_09336 [Aureobasidium subglaciale]|nr:hypothetical protein E4T42_09336 [Aureobasidium subglaciale]